MRQRLMRRQSNCQHLVPWRTDVLIQVKIWPVADDREQVANLSQSVGDCESRIASDALRAENIEIGLRHDEGLWRLLVEPACRGGLRRVFRHLQFAINPTIGTKTDVGEEPNDLG